MNIKELIESEAREGPDLEYKSVDAHPGSILKELVAFANNEGGRVIIGVRESEGEIEGVEDVAERGNPSGLEETLHGSIHDKVEPAIHLDFEEFQYNSKTLVKISVGDQHELHSVSINGKPTFPIRYGSTIAYLNATDISRAYGIPDDVDSVVGLKSEKETQEGVYDHSKVPRWDDGIFRSASVESISPADAPIYSSPENRLIVEAGEHQITVFGQTGIDPVHATHSTVRLQDYVSISNMTELRKGLQTIQSISGTSSYRTHSYSIKYRSRQLLGRGIKNFFEDARRISELCDRLTPGNETAGNKPRPIGVLSFPLKTGIGLLSLQWEGDSIRPSKSSMQILLNNIPLDPSPFQELFEDLGGEPQSFREKTRLQLLRIKGQSILQDTHKITFQPGQEFNHQEIVATNPFFQESDQIRAEFDIELPGNLANGLAGVNRLPFAVAGGLHPDDKSFRMDQIEWLQLDGLINTFIIDPFSRVHETQADIPQLSIPEGIDGDES